MGDDDSGLRVAVAPPVLVLDEVTAKLGLDDRPRRPVELALVVAPVDGLREAVVLAVRPRVLGGPERDVGWDHERRVEQHESLDLAGAPGRVLEREARAERVAEPRGLPAVQRRIERLEVVGDPPRRLPR